MRRSVQIRPSRTGECENGQAAVFGVFLLMLFAAYAVFLFMNFPEEGSSIAYGLRAREAVYAAETGLEYAIEGIRSGAKGGGNIAHLKVGSATVEVTDRGDTLLSATAKTDDPSLTRSIDLSIEVSSLPSAFYHALYVARERTLRLDAAVRITGNVLVDGNELSLGSKVILEDGLLYLPREAEIVNPWRRPFERHDYMYRNEPPDDFPVLRTGYYDGYVNNVHGYESVDPVVNKKTKLKHFEDSVMYRNGDLSIQDDVEGPGIICASGDITVSNHCNVGPDVKIIAGNDIRIGDARVTSGKTIDCLMFSRGNTLLSEGSDIEASILALRDFSLSGKVRLKGICFVSGFTSFEGSYEVEGSIVTARVTSFRGAGTLAFRESILDRMAIPGLQGRPRVQRVAWREA